MVAIEAFELVRVRLPMVAPFRAAHGKVRERDTVLVRALTDDGEGWGECPALPAPTYTAEYLDAAEQVLASHVLPPLRGRTVAAGEVPELLAHITGWGFAKAAAELAVLDVELRVEGRSLAARLGATQPVVDCGVAVGIADTAVELVETVEQLLEHGYRRVKLKVTPGWDVEPVKAVRAAIGDDVLLQVDANGSYRAGDLDPLKALEPFGLAAIEQPFPADALLAHAEATKRLRTPIALDESITSLQVAADAINLRACDVMSIKPGHVGGWRAARQIHDLCHDVGLPLFLGGMLESGVGRAANVALAALPGFTLPGDLAPARRWFADDVAAALAMEGGRMVVPATPGLGVSVDPDAVARLEVRRTRV